MRNRLKNLIILLALFAQTSAAGAQELRTMPNLNQAVRNNWLKFRIISGRVMLDGSQVGNMQLANNFNQQQDQISIQSDGGDTVLSYVWSNSKRQLSIDVSNVSKVRILYSGKGDDPQVPLEFHQPLQGKTVLKIGPEGKQQIYSAPSLWHLFLAYPDETKKHLVPLLELLHPNWKLPDAVASVEIELLKRTGSNELSERKHWAELVEQLGDDSYAKRQAADRALRAANTAVLSYLQQLDFSRLDVEQQFRVSRIIEAISDRLGEDSPEQVATWLAGDIYVWSTLLTRSDVATRRHAAQQLTAMTGGPIPVDPDADPSTQKTQLEQLRQSLESSAKKPK
jgi:hypothetical protein